MKSLSGQTLAIIFITSLALWLRAVNLGAVNFYHDEYLQFETAVGLITTGQYARYDFYHATVAKPYTRAAVFIWQVVVSMQAFGINEAAARLPALLWGVALVPVLFFIVRQVTGNPWIALLTSWLVTFDALMIGLSRYVRMYTMVIVFSTLMVYCLYQFLSAWSQRRQRYIYLGGFIVSTIVHWLVFKELTLALLAGIGVYVLCRGILFLGQRHVQDIAWAWATGLGLLLVASLITLDQLWWRFLPLDAVIIREQPHWTYATQLFSSWLLPWLAAGWFVLGCVISRTGRSFTGMAAMIVIVVLTYFVFFSHRWEAQRYIGFIVPLVYVVVATGWYWVLQLVWRQLRRWRWLATVVVAATFIITGPVLTLPGVFGQALADQSASQLGYPDMRSVYQAVAEKIQPGEIVLIQGPRFYYWPNRSVPLYKLGGYKSLSLQDFKDLARSGQHGGWLIYNKPNQRHIREDIKLYAKKYFHKHPEFNDALVVVYHFTGNIP
ncbi:MAG: glycosyltransferase family 39 protein [Candidatus Kerfeldbacteria bacterium]|nr:glycosyltransferase family 39 protein [Candidatus Kerfeldbacteria bacterium]